MEEQRQIEAMAKLDGLIDLGKIPSSNSIFGHDILVGTIKAEIDDKMPMNDQPWREVPAYLTSHDAVQRVIDGLSDDELESYLEELGVSLMEKAIADGVFTQKQIDAMGDLELASECVKLQAKATPAQKAEAILKATGKWEQE